MGRSSSQCKNALRAGLSGLTAVLLVSCGVLQPAQMQLPDSLIQRTTEYAVTDMGGGTRGNYRIGEHSGTFKRSETRLQFFDIAEFRAGGADFTLSGPLIEGQIEAHCKMRERLLNLGDFSFTTKPMAYGCDFTVNKRSFPARFEIQEASTGIAGALLKNERRGEIAIDRVILQLQSVHRVVGSPLQLANPIGYEISLNGDVIAAVELNGTPRVWLPTHTDIPTQRAVVAAAMALAVFWDPADSAL